MRQTVMHFFRILWWTESSKERHSLKSFNIKNVFTVTFDNFNASLLNSLKGKSYWPQTLNDRLVYLHKPEFAEFAVSSINTKIRLTQDGTVVPKNPPG